MLGARVATEVKTGLASLVDEYEADAQLHERREQVSPDRSIAMTMLYDKGHNLDERILSEQFTD